MGVKSAKKRKQQAATVFTANRGKFVCARQRFPEQTVVAGIEPFVTTPDKSTKQVYADLDQIRGVGGTLKSEHFLMMESKDKAVAHLTAVCEAVVKVGEATMVKKIAKHKSGRVFGAITDRWLCNQYLPVCPNEEVPPTADDEDEDREEL